MGYFSVRDFARGVGPWVSPVGIQKRDHLRPPAAQNATNTQVVILLMVMLYILLWLCAVVVCCGCACALVVVCLWLWLCA